MSNKLTGGFARFTSTRLPPAFTYCPLHLAWAKLAKAFVPAKHPVRLPPRKGCLACKLRIVGATTPAVALVAALIRAAEILAPTLCEE